MRKSFLALLSLMMVASVLLAACGGAPEAPATAPVEPAAPAATAEPAEPAAPAASGEKTVLNVWSFTNEINTMAIAFEGKHPDVDVVYTMIPMTNGEYQTKLKAAIGTADTPDVIALEAAFVKEYVEADFLADLSDLLPYAEENKTYPFVTDVGTERRRDQGLCLSGYPGRRFLSPQPGKRILRHR